MTALFGTDGIRGQAGEGILTPLNLIRLGNAIGAWAQEKYGNATDIVIICDTRISASIIKSALKVGLLECALNIIDGGVLPTPAALVLMQHMHNAHVAIVISASHNPYHDNGIKILDRTTGKLQALDESIISGYYTTPSQRSKGWGIDRTLNNSRDIYQQKLIAQFPAKYLQGLRIVVDSGNGALSGIAKEVLTHCGAEIIDIHCTPSGYNINEASGSNNPQHVARAVKELDAHVGFAFDGDGDRLIAVNHHGEIKNGDDLLCILQTHPRYRNITTLVGTVMTNEGLAQHCAAHKMQLIRTAVGDKHIMKILSEQGLVLGGEASGHVILYDIFPLGDALLNALTVIETMILTGNWNLSSFSPYPQALQNIPVQHRYNLDTEPFKSCITKYEQMMTSGRMLVRYSGTENVLRVMVETTTQQQAEVILHTFVNEITDLLATPYAHRENSVQIHSSPCQDSY